MSREIVFYEAFGMPEDEDAAHDIAREAVKTTTVHIRQHHTGRYFIAKVLDTRVVRGVSLRHLVKEGDDDDDLLVMAELLPTVDEAMSGDEDELLQ